VGVAASSGIPRRHALAFLQQHLAAQPHLAAGVDDVADLLDRDLDGDDTWRVFLATGLELIS
jgi:hypothetical protein